MNEQTLERMSKDLDIDIFEIKKALKLSDSIIDETDGLFHHLELLEDPDCPLIVIAEAYEKVYGKDGEHSVIASKLLGFWAEQSIKEFDRAFVARDLKKMRSVYICSPDDGPLNAFMIQSMATFYKKK